jgi:hypothetical protein
VRVERFFHLRPDLNNGGATVRVVGETDNPGHVDVQVAFCHTHAKVKEKDKGDAYNKRTGRKTAADARVRIIPLRHLPKELNKLWDEAHRRSGWGAFFNAPDYHYAMKYFLPKE